MYKTDEHRYINAGENVFYKYGRKAQAYVEACLKPNENGYYSIVADGNDYWTIGTSIGKYGEFARFGNDFLSVNSAGYVYAKVGTPKEQVFINMINRMLDDMRKANAARVKEVEED